MESEWIGSVENAFFNADAFDRNRIINAAEYEASGRAGKGTYYILSVDVGRLGDNSVVSVIKVTPQNSMTSLKQLVNIYSFEKMHFEEQAIMIKNLYYKFKCRRVIIDGNGVGAGLVDYLVKSQSDDVSGEYYPPFGVYNDENNLYKKYRTNETEDDVLYIVKANAPFNTEMYSILQSQLSAGKVKFLIDEKVKKNKLLGMKQSQTMSPEERAEYLLPFTLTSVLREELLNLREENEGVNIILKQANRAIKKDKVSSLGMGLYYIKYEEDDKKKKRKRSMSEFLFMS